MHGLAGHTVGDARGSIPDPPDLRSNAGTPTRIARHLAPWRRWLLLTGRRRMFTETLDSSRLFELIGDAARLLPDSAIASLELMLARQEAPLRSTGPMVLAGVRNGGFIGNRSREGLGDQEREALGAILEILHASQQEDRDADGGDLDDRLVEGLIVAGRLIVDGRVAVG